MNHETAEIVKAQALAAIRKPLGFLIGQIDGEILLPVYRKYPDLDDLAENER